ncbi:LLM class flavin-dependent oxidoreductase, partial [Kineococcus sp. SYSU DK001]|uniref:LLM class flavin-dependent oxidoreductase n=1 Tax=Kineococcus sp. SYSU DK001 TaxID=3383122 RepID=UPI003D7E87B2
GRRGYQPMSQAVHGDVLVKHWETYEKAARGAGHDPRREDWRVSRLVFVADTDEEARALVRDGDIGRLWREENLANFTRLGLTDLLTGGEVDASDLTVDWLIENQFFVGSPQTVADKIRALYEHTGGFGGVQTSTYDFSDHPEAYERNFQLIGERVAPLLADLTGDEQRG